MVGSGPRHLTTAVNVGTSAIGSSVARVIDCLRHLLRICRSAALSTRHAGGRGGPEPRYDRGPRNIELARQPGEPCSRPLSSFENLRLLPLTQAPFRRLRLGRPCRVLIIECLTKLAYGAREVDGSSGLRDAVTSTDIGKSPVLQEM